MSVSSRVRLYFAVILVINYLVFGTEGTAVSPYDHGRTATHEVGHWLGLLHPFDGSCSGLDSISCKTEGDRICDTPPMADSHMDCPETINTCHESFPADLNDMTMNFMEYSGFRSNCFTSNLKGSIFRAFT